MRGRKQKLNSVFLLGLGCSCFISFVHNSTQQNWWRSMKHRNKHWRTSKRGQHHFSAHLTQPKTKPKRSTTNFLAPAKKEKEKGSTEKKLGGKARPDQKESKRSNIALSWAIWHRTQNKSCSANRRGQTQPCNWQSTQCLPTCLYTFVTVLVSAHCNSFTLRRQKERQDPTPLPLQQCGNQLAGALALRRPVEKQVLL